MKNLYEKLLVTSIRSSATRMVGPCNDFQIIFVAMAAGKLSVMKASLEELDEAELKRLQEWMHLELQRTPHINTQG